jgi:hypothetical protein
VGADKSAVQRRQKIMLVTGSYVEEQPGVSVRDEFAKAAMQGFLAVAGPNTEADYANGLRHG